MRRAASRLAERLFAHIHKEEHSLLPALDELLAFEADQQLAQAYERRR